MNTRQTIFVSVFVILLILLGAWWYFGFSLDFMRFFAAEPLRSPAAQPPRQTVGPETPVPPAGSVGCLVITRSVGVGSNVIVNASGGNGTYSWFAPEGTPSTGTGATFTTSYAVPGRKQITVQGGRTSASDPAGSTNTTTGTQFVDSVACIVNILSTQR